MLKRKKNGELTLTSIILIILAVLSFFVSWAIISPIWSSEVQIGAKAQVCKVTLALSKAITIPSVVPFVADSRIITPLCSTDRIKVTKKLVKKHTEAGETKKEGAMRMILEKMKTCEAIMRGSTKKGIFEDTSCYVCFSLEPDKSFTQKITAAELNEFMLDTLSPRDILYTKDLQKGKQLVSFSLNKGVVNLGKKEYAISYVDSSEAAGFGFLTSIGGGCIAGLVAVGAVAVFTAGAGLSLTIPALALCGTGAVAGGAHESYVKWFQEKKFDTLLLTELEKIDQGCDQYVS